MKSCYKLAGKLFGMMTILFLIISVQMVPHGRSIADDGSSGGGGPEGVAGCTGGNDCDNKSQCFVSQPSCDPPSKTACWPPDKTKAECGSCKCLLQTSQCLCREQ